MKALYNEKIVDYDKVMITPDDRGFNYGDGFFETVIFREGSLSNLNYHFERVSEAMEAFYFNRPDYLTNSYLLNMTLQLISENGFNDSARVKWIFWRKKGGLYTPESHNINILIQIFYHSENRISPVKKLSFSETAGVCVSRYSAFKTINAIDYIMAAIEKNRKRINDLILMNPEGYIAECIASNIFWKKDNYLYTPSLESGCINGVMRRHIIDKFRKSDQPVLEGLFSKEELLMADNVFLTNAAGFYPVKYIDDRRFTKPENLESLDPLN